MILVSQFTILLLDVMFIMQGFVFIKPINGAAGSISMHIDKRIQDNHFANMIIGKMADRVSEIYIDNVDPVVVKKLPKMSNLLFIKIMNSKINSNIVEFLSLHNVNRLCFENAKFIDGTIYKGIIDSREFVFSKCLLHRHMLEMSSCAIRSSSLVIIDCVVEGKSHFNRCNMVNNRIVVLTIRNTNIADDHISIIGNIFPKLRSITIDKSMITSNVIKELTKMDQLLILNLSNNNNINDSITSSVITSSSIKSIDLTGTNVTKSAVHRMEESGLIVRKAY